MSNQPNVTMDDDMPARLEVDPDARNDDPELKAVVASFLSSDPDKVPEEYRDILAQDARTYYPDYKGSKYWGPNDAQEEARLNIQHHMFRFTMDGQLYLAPLTNPKSCLDICSGSGIWAVEFAKQHPSCAVTGSDLAPITPPDTPPNCNFEKYDVEDDTWPEGATAYDFIHARAVLVCFKDNAAMARRIFAHLAPGGYFELQDPVMPLRSDDGSLAGTALEEWGHVLAEGMFRAGGRRVDGSTAWAGHLRAAGFVDVVERRYLWPVSPWCRGKRNKILGALCQVNLMDGVPSMGSAVGGNMLGWSRDRIDDFVDRARRDLTDMRVHVYTEMYVVYGRKPQVVVD